jgi:hypothetical protein
MDAPEQATYNIDYGTVYGTMVVPIGQAAKPYDCVQVKP